MNIFLWHVHGSWTTAFVQGPPPLLPAGRRRSLAVGAAAGPARGTGRTSVVEVDADAAHDAAGRRRRAATAGGARRRSPSGGSAGGDRAATSPPSTWSTTPRRAASPRCATRPPIAPGITVVHVTAFNDLFWDCGSTPTRRHRARHRRSRLPLHRRAAAAGGRDQRAGAARPGHRDRPAAPVRARPARSTCSAWAPPSSGGIEDLPQHGCTPRWPGGGCTSTRSGGRRSGCRCSRRCTSACRSSPWRRPRSRSRPAERRRRLDLGRRARRRRPRGSWPILTRPARRVRRHAPRRSAATASAASCPTGTTLMEEVTAMTRWRPAARRARVRARQPAGRARRRRRRRPERPRRRAGRAPRRARGVEVDVYTRRDDPTCPPVVTARGRRTTSCTSTPVRPAPIPKDELLPYMGDVRRRSFAPAWTAPAGPTSSTPTSGCPAWRR